VRSLERLLPSVTRVGYASTRATTCFVVIGNGKRSPELPARTRR